jgi:hypothetical protein
VLQVVHVQRAQEAYNQAAVPTTVLLLPATHNVPAIEDVYTLIKHQHQHLQTPDSASLPSA